jgi:hypothetical protein
MVSCSSKSAAESKVPGIVLLGCDGASAQPKLQLHAGAGQQSGWNQQWILLVLPQLLIG